MELCEWFCSTRQRVGFAPEPVETIQRESADRGFKVVKELDDLSRLIIIFATQP